MTNTYHTYHSHFRIWFSYFIWIYFTENMRLLSEDAKYLDERKTGWILTVNLMLSSRGAYQNFREKDLFIFVDLITLEHPEMTVNTVCLLLKIPDFLFICWKLNYRGHFLYEHKYLASSFEMIHHRLADICCNKFNAKRLRILSHQPYLIWLNQTWVRFFISCGWLAQVWISSNHTQRRTRSRTNEQTESWLNRWSCFASQQTRCTLW